MPARMNAPTFAYYAVYGERPSGGSLRGRTDSPKKTWKGIPDVDIHIRDEWLEELNSIEEIEVRATDEGKSEERVAFVIFRMADPSQDERAGAVSKRLDQMSGVYSEYNVGAEDRPRIVAAGKVQYGEPGWEEWWNSISGKIKRTLQESSVKDKDVTSKATSVGWYPGKVLERIFFR